MKKILLAVTAALAITGCSQNEEFDNAAQNAEIGFNTIVSKATRASELKTEGLKTNGGFKVFAYNTGENDMAAASVLSSPAFMDDVLVSWNTSTSKWTMAPAGPYYWPIDEKLQFFSYSPVANVTYNKPNGTDAGYPSFSYTVPSTQEDLVVAYVNDATKENATAGALTLPFKHILTQVNFKLKGKDADYTYKVTAITLSGINSAGTFTYAKPITTPTSSLGSWANSTTPAEYTYEVATYDDFTSAADLTIATGSNGLMLMPQTLGADAKVEISYSTVYGGKIVFKGTKAVSLKDIVWNAGDKILYTLSLPGGAEEVTFTPEVSTWNGETSGGEKEAQ